MSERRYTLLDQFFISAQEGLETLFAPATANRPNPADDIQEETLTEHESQLSARLMRINHAGEVCAQALYRGQALTASDAAVCDSMAQAAAEEEDHLAWCETRLHELGSHTSYLNPFWYVSSFTIGAIAGAIGDKWSLGFVEETELQVTEHLQHHLELISPKDQKSRAILDQMKIDEQDHAEKAREAGAHELPMLVKGLMTCTSKLMTHTTYWI